MSPLDLRSDLTERARKIWSDVDKAASRVPLWMRHSCVCRGGKVNAESLARELHDVAFAWNHSMQPWDGLTEEQREWFRDRAKGILTVDIGALGEDTPYRRTLRSNPPATLDPAAVRQAVAAAKASAEQVRPTNEQESSQ